ncbi:hypothetical protein [Halarchaeum salinum]|uniref:Uncharacterized protein n=1 Tax=Halarchaeum salinum TaxID=489912 RepID=A0AAV3S1T9_9EURY
MSDPRTSITLRENTGKKLRDLKEASNAGTWDDFFTGIVEEEENIEVNLDDLNTVELEKTEKAQETRAMAIGVLEAMQRTGIKEDVLDLIEELRKTEMVEMNKRVVQHILQKAKSGEALNEADRALLDMVVEIETQRDSGPEVGSVIAEGLFGETEEQTAEQTTTRTDAVRESSTEETSIDLDESIFTGVEDAERSDIGIDTQDSDAE